MRGISCAVDLASSGRKTACRHLPRTRQRSFLQRLPLLYPWILQAFVSTQPAPEFYFLRSFAICSLLDGAATACFLLTFAFLLCTYLISAESCYLSQHFINFRIFYYSFVHLLAFAPFHFHTLEKLRFFFLSDRKSSMNLLNGFCLFILNF